MPFSFGQQAGTSYKLLFDFFRKGEIEKIAKGVSIPANDPNNPRLHFIGHGYIKVISRNSEGEEVVYMIYGPGDVFPLLPIVSYISSDIEYVTLSTVKLFSHSQDYAIKQVCSELELSNAMFERSIMQFANAANNMTNLGYKRANERLVYKLLTMCARYGCVHDSQIKIDKIFTHKLIASIIHTSRETVTRELDKLRKKGYIKTIDHSLIVLDIDGLHSELEKPIVPTIMQRIKAKKQCKKHEASAS